MGRCEFSLYLRRDLIFVPITHVVNTTQTHSKCSIFPPKPYINATTETETYSLALELLLALVGGVLLVMYRFVLSSQPQAAVSQQFRDAKAQLLLTLDAAYQPLVFASC